MSNASWLTQIKKGLLELCILNLLDKQSMYGYQIVKYLRDIPGLVATEGTIYPLLGRLKREGLVTTSFRESPSGPVRKDYELSAEGKKRLREINRIWEDISSAIDELISRDEGKKRKVDESKGKRNEAENPRSGKA